MAWEQLSILVPEKEVEQANLFLTLLDAQAVSILNANSEPVYEPELNSSARWKYNWVVGLFNENTDFIPIINFLKRQLNAKANLHYQIQHIDDRDWERISEEQFQPTHIKNDLWICPSWSEPPQVEQAKIVMLDPGLAFGTGTHPTTNLCLAWLADQTLTQQTLIDYGCGSGILGLAALKLDAQHVYAVDHDRQALLATQNNCELNHFNQQTLSCYSPEQLPDLNVDLLVANILMIPLIQLAPKFANYLKPKGKILLSGILTEQVDELRQHYQPLFSFTESYASKQWACLVAEKNE